MKTELKKELILTLDHTEIEKLREELVQLPLWKSNGELRDYYVNSPIGELWFAVSQK